MNSARLRVPTAVPAPKPTQTDMASEPVDHPDTPSSMSAEAAHPFKPQLVMCEPRFLSTAIPNNVFMEGEHKEPVDRPRAITQFRRIKHLITALDTDVLEIPPEQGAQDQAFVANIAIAMDPFIILAHYKAPGRDVEVPPAKRFFEGLGYETIQPPFHFEGEADLKKLTDDIYIGGYGKFTDIRALDWIEETTEREIVRVREISDELYHLDCSLMVLDDAHVMVSAEGIDRASLKAIEQVAEIIPVPKGLASSGVTNGVKIVDKKVYLSGTLQPEDEEYRKGIEWLLDALDPFGYVVTFVDTDAVNASGADLSCMVMHLDFPPSAPNHPKGVAARSRPMLARGA